MQVTKEKSRRATVDTEQDLDLMVKFASQNSFRTVEFFVQYVGFMRGVNIKGVSNQTFTLTGFLPNIK